MKGRGAENEVYLRIGFPYFLLNVALSSHTAADTYNKLRIKLL